MVKAEIRYGAQFAARSAFIFQRFMNRAHIAQAGASPKNPRLHDNVAHRAAAALVNIDAPAQQPHHPAIMMHPANPFPDLRAVAGGKIFVGVGKHHPIPRRFSQGKIFRRRKIINPREGKDPRSGGFGQVYGSIRRAGVNDDDLVRYPAHRRQPARQILFFVFDDDASRYFNHEP